MDRARATRKKVGRLLPRGFNYRTKMAAGSTPIRGLSQLRFVSLLLVCLVVAAATTPPSFTEDIERKIDTFAKKIMTCRDIVGISMAVVSGNTTLMAKGYGLANRATGQPMTGSTLCGIASLTKAFAATLLTKLLSKSR